VLKQKLPALVCPFGVIPQRQYLNPIIHGILSAKLFFCFRINNETKSFIQPACRMVLFAVAYVNTINMMLSDKVVHHQAHGFSGDPLTLEPFVNH
jgi:hypothetical protein